MGVINITPDWFSDGGYYFDPPKALNQARNCIQNGADILDIGGQSTRPGAEVIEAEVEIKRILPMTHKSVFKHVLYTTNGQTSHWN